MNNKIDLNTGFYIYYVDIKYTYEVEKVGLTVKYDKCRVLDDIKVDILSSNTRRLRC